MDEQAVIVSETPIDKDDITPESERNLVDKVLATIRSDKDFHAAAFRRMRDDMHIATHGRPEGWPADHYTANIIGRHVKQKTAALYAKNPKIVAGRRETLDFEIWDESLDSITQAFMEMQQFQQAQAVAAAQPPAIDMLTGMMVPPPMPEPPAETMALLADFQTGMDRRKQLTKLGKTLEILFNHAMRDQKPLDFKMGMKKLVRRTCTTGVGYVKIAFTREYGPSAVVSSQLTDIRNRLAHLDVLRKDLAEGDIDEISAEMRELELSLSSLETEAQVVVSEGLIFDYPQSTRVIPDENTTSLVGFQGARHLAVEYLYTVDEVREQFPDADLDKGFTPHRRDWTNESDNDRGRPVSSDSKGRRRGASDKTAMVRVFEYFDKPSGLVYYVADGHPFFLRPPAAPDVFVEDFWPVYALTFNEVENEDEVFPPSDARLMLHQQLEINRARQGSREHREAARPRFVTAQGALDDKDKAKLASARPFDVIEVNKTPDQKIGDMIEAVPVPGVDPNLYETGTFFEDMQLVVGSQHASMGGIAKATATESAIAANSMAASDGSAVDDLDNFLTVVARASGQVLLREMSAEQVRRLVGPGAFWPELPLEEIADELYLEIEAGSSGKPNQGVEIDNWQKMLPMMLQMPGLNPEWLLRETVRRLDDRLDTTDAITAGLPSIASMNQGAQANAVSPEGPASDPAAQGAAGAGNAPAGPSMIQPGSDAAFGSNQV